MGAFYETKVFFLESQVFSTDSYNEWMDTPDYTRSAGLYVTFYKEIITAWNKVKSFYTPEEDGVSCILQYLQKNQSIIENDEKKFDARYIYRVAFNCLYCICHDIKRDRDRWDNETSNIVYSGESEINLFDEYIPSNGYRDCFEYNDLCELWDVLESVKNRWKLEDCNDTDVKDKKLNDLKELKKESKEDKKRRKAEAKAASEKEYLEILKVVDHLINGSSLKKTGENSKLYEYDKLRDISVSSIRKDEIVAELRTMLHPYQEYLY